MNIQLTADGRRALRQLAAIRKRSVAFAIKSATDKVGGALISRKNGLIQREWNRTFDVKRRTFPSRVLRLRRARVVGERVGIPTRVVNVAADDLLSDQMRGGVRQPRQGSSLLLPAKRGRKARRGKGGRFVERVRGRDVLFEERKRGGPKVVGVLVRSARIPGRFSLRRPVAEAGRLLPRVLERELERELKRAESRR